MSKRTYLLDKENRNNFFVKKEAEAVPANMPPRTPDKSDEPTYIIPYDELRFMALGIQLTDYQMLNEGMGVLYHLLDHTNDYIRDMIVCALARFNECYEILAENQRHTEDSFRKIFPEMAKEIDRGLGGKKQ